MLAGAQLRVVDPVGSEIPECAPTADAMPDSTPATLGNVRDAVGNIQASISRVERQIEHSVSRIEASERERHLTDQARFDKIERQQETMVGRLALLESYKQRILDARWLVAGMITIVLGGVWVGWIVLDKLDDAMRARQAFDTRVTDQLKKIEGQGQ